MEAQTNYLTILHFNDVYNIEENKVEPVGGVARFKTALESFKNLDPLVLFSGDLFQPSLLSTAYDGEQMLKPINSLKVDVACYGNHDFDLGVDTLTSYSKQCNFPWLLSNVKAKIDNQNLANSRETFILHKNGLKIGFMGLAEKDWVFEETVLEPEDVNFEDYIVCATRLTKYLREEENCDFIIALTHMRNKHDRDLANKFTDIDLILGGHDHVNLKEKVNGTYVVKSGSDFVEFNKIAFKLADSESSKEEIYKERFLVNIETIQVTKAFEPDAELQTHVNDYLIKFEEKMKEPMFHSSVELETSFKEIRTSEQNFSNFFADLVRLDSGCDCALVNSGTFRSNRRFSPGVFTLGDIRLVLPWEDSVVKLRLTGEQLWKTLENSVATLPVTDGRFLAVSGITFSFDPQQKPGSRVSLDSIQIKEKPLYLTEFYTIATKPYMRAGKDGYVILKDVECLTEEGEDIHLTLKKFFVLAKDPHVVALWTKSSGNIDFVQDKSGEEEPLEKEKLHLYNKLHSLIHDIVFVDQEYFISIAPKVEGRIIMLNELHIH